MYTDGCELLVLTALLTSVSLPKNKFFDRLRHGRRICRACKFGMGLYALAVEYIGIDKGRYDHGERADQENPERAKKAGQHDQKTAYCPEPAGKAVGPGPVFLAVQSPGDLDADGVILLALGQIIADDGKYETYEDRHDHFHGHILAQSGCVGDHEQQVRNGGDEPKDQL